ncbi:LuxR family transcriptional regulator [Isoptericola hypogeus]|uniref:LuxR family transcriptional regulator n=1 Tax=Isoptericola hypogeus TaxID=300179 RepID=A0ABP4VJ48_9MICO
MLVGALTRRPALVVVSGEAGIGKTRLVRAAVTTPGVCRHAVVGSSRWARVPVPLGPLVEGLRHHAATLATLALPAVAGALRPWLPELCDVLPPDAGPPGDVDTARHRVLRAVREVVGALGDVVVVLEDVDRADDLTLELVGYLAADPPPGLGLVVTFRDDEQRTPLPDLIAHARAVHRATLRLGPLSVDGTRQLAASLTDAELLPDDVAEGLHERSGGVPLVVEELVGALADQGLLVGDDETVALRPGPSTVPEVVREAVLARARALSPQARRIVDVAAVLHRPTTVDVLAACASTTEESALEAIEEALRAGVLVEHGAEPGFRHPLAAEAVHDAVPRLRRIRLHARAADVLERLGAEPARVAPHRWHAGQLDAWAVAVERAAQEAVERGDDGRAARLLEDLLRHGPLPDDRWAETAVRLGRAAVRSIHTGPEVLDLLERATGLAGDRSDRGELHLAIALLRSQVDRDPQSRREHYLRAVDDLGDRPDLQAWAMVGLGEPTYPGRRPDETRRWLHRSLAAVPAVAAGPDRVFLWGKAAMVLVAMGDPAWRARVDDMVGTTGGVPAGRRETSAFESVAADAAYSGHHDLARDLIGAVPDAAASEAGPGIALRVRRTAAAIDYCTGRWDGLDRRLLVLARNAGAYPSVRVATDALRGSLALARGDLVRAERLLERAVRERDAADLRPIPAGALIRLLAARDRPADAFDLGRRVLDHARGSGLLAPAVRVLPFWVGTALRVGEADAAAAVVGDLARDLVGLDVPLARAAERHATGLVERGAREWERAAATLLEAATAYDRRGCRYEAAMTRELAGGCLLDAGDPGAPALLTAALDTYRTLGATWDEARAARTARSAGIAAPARHRGGRRGYGEELSPREQEVAALAAVGRTDREIARELHLSPRTVEKHVAAARRKLGAATRSALAHRLGVR